MKNKQVKQMIADIVLHGRKAVWYGEESEIFAANSVKQCHEEYSYEDDDECLGEIISSHWKFWWQPCLFEFDYRNEKIKGKQYTDNRDIIQHYQRLPLICAVYGSTNDISQVSTSYN